MGCPSSRRRARMHRRPRSTSPRTSSRTTTRHRHRRCRRIRSSRIPRAARSNRPRRRRSLRKAPTTRHLPRTKRSNVPRPVTVAITGGIAAGKSEALAAFARHGAATASSAAVVHDLLAGDEDVRAAIRARGGDDAVGNRTRIGEIVFGDRSELEWLEALLHPKTRAALDAWVGSVEAPLAVVEIPLLYETGGGSRFDHVVVITAPRETREARRPATA